MTIYFIVSVYLTVGNVRGIPLPGISDFYEEETPFYNSQSYNRQVKSNAKDIHKILKLIEAIIMGNNRQIQEKNKDELEANNKRITSLEKEKGKMIIN